MAKSPSPLRASRPRVVPVPMPPAPDHSHEPPELIGFPTVLTVKSTIDTIGLPVFIVDVQGAYKRENQVHAATTTKVATNVEALLELLGQTYSPEFPADDLPDEPEESLP